MSWCGETWEERSSGGGHPGWEMRCRAKRSVKDERTESGRQ